MSSESPHIVILGAGINGCALARELLLNGVSVTLVDQADIASGATAYSSRLIHGGLRYLEYGEFDLVRESLAERTRLLRVAPQFVHPLQLFIPLDNRLGGVVSAARKFFGWQSAKASEPASRRGAWVVRLGLWFYDRCARGSSLPKHQLHKIDGSDISGIDHDKFRWLYSYYDAQVLYPERFTLALVKDARLIAQERTLEFNLFTYHRVKRTGQDVSLHALDRSGAPVAAATQTLQPDIVINATGAWVDLTFEELKVRAPQLMGGTKGSHLITFNTRLRDALRGNGIYAEAADGRPVFILPFGNGTLIGTTDEPYPGDPSQVRTSDEEIEYLLTTANQIVPEVRLSAQDVALHYCGVRPLPYVNAATPGAVTRRHAIREMEGTDPPVYAIIGGKLTTCRSLAEECTKILLTHLGRAPQANSEDRLLPGADNYPPNQAAVRANLERLAARHSLTVAQVESMWLLCGTQVEEIFAHAPSFSPENLLDTNLPLDFVRWVIQHEWVTTLDDLVHRRLMLIFAPQLSARGVRQLAALLVDSGKLAQPDADSTVEHTLEDLAQRFGKHLPR